ncbi:MAG: type IX secretion system PorP/SprF family membrane protein [Planctomycetota bacterium]|jgi:type IX secretion system PorP/SprF family membrane protein
MKKILIIVIVLVMALKLSAQDIHFSQYNAQPLLLNPALSGLNECDYRVGALFRTQWFSVSQGNTYRTISAFADMAIVKPRRSSNFLGAGLSVYADQAGDLNYNTTKVDLSLAYHIILDRNTQQSFSLGLQGGFAHRSIDQSKAIFSYDPVTGVPNANPASIETLNSDPLFYGDLSVGFLWSIKPKPTSSYHVGFAVQHLNQPNISGLYSQNDNERQYMKFTGHFGSLIPISKRLSIMPGFLLLKQGPSFEANISNYFKFNFSDNPSNKTAIYFGTMYRVLDAVIVAVRADIKGVSLNFSYDINVSKLTPSSKANGGLELAVSYTGCVKREYKKTYCPDF